MGSINDNHYTTGAEYSRRGSNPRPPAHKTGALPLSYWSRGLCAGWDPGPAGMRSQIKKKKEVCIPDGTRTHNLRLRKPTPCPFGHWDDTMPEVGFEPTRTEAQQILNFLWTFIRCKKIEQSIIPFLRFCLLKGFAHTWLDVLTRVSRKCRSGLSFVTSYLFWLMPCLMLASNSVQSCFLTLVSKLGQGIFHVPYSG